MWLPNQNVSLITLFGLKQTHKVHKIKLISMTHTLFFFSYHLFEFVTLIQFNFFNFLVSGYVSSVVFIV